MHPMRTPSLSVILPINKVDGFFRAALNSVLTQTMSSFELIIIANGMPDNHFSILQDLCQCDSRIKLLRLKLPGLANALNIGLDSACADIVARMDADDLSMPNRFQVQMDYMSRNPKAVVVGSKATLINSNGYKIGDYKYYQSNEEIRKVLPYRNPIIHPSVMMRKDALIALGGYRYGHMSEDHELFIRISRNPEYKFYNIPESLFCYRRHYGQITDFSRAKQHYAEISGFLLTEFLLTGNSRYLLGSFAIHPKVRFLRGILKSLTQKYRAK